MRTLSGFHRAVVKVSGGRLGGALLGLSSIELITVGRRSGKARVSMLTVPVRVAVSGGPARPMLARVATPEERAELWPRVTAALSNYAEYQTRTSRVIPLVLLEPA